MTRRRFAGALAVLLAAGCGDAPAPRSDAGVAPAAALKAHSAEFERGVIEVTDGVHVAVGFGLANSILIEGTDGFIVVDTMETLAEAEAVNAEFRRITGERPLKALVYTHNHADHVFGAAGFIAPGETPEVYAHELVPARMDAVVTEFRPIIGRRSLRMFGTYLTGDALINDGIGPFLGVREGSRLSIVRPTTTFRDALTVQVAGRTLELVHAPGETDDQLFVWMPKERVLLPGDNFYKAFPNLYTIRGTPYRNPRRWADSLEVMRDLGAEYLVPSHTRPLSGADHIRAVLTDYRDAIRFIYDQTVRAMNQGLTPDEIVERVQLPRHLAESPYLQHFYGKPSWSARMVFGGSLGWFDGNPSTLQPLSPEAAATRMAALVGGDAALRDAVLAAVQSGDHQWALELSDHALRRLPGDRGLRDARVAALLALGEAEANPNARHYYLTRALELRDGLEIPEQVAQATPEMLSQMPLSAFFTALSVNLDAEASLDMDRKVGFEFSDSGERWTLWVRRGVAETQPRLLEGLEMRVRMPAQAFKEMLARTRNPALTIARDIEMVEGNKVGFAAFLRLFQPRA